jgi:hypothetical protein
VPQAVIPTYCAHAPLQRLLAWCRHREVTWWRHGGRTDRILAAAVPAEIEGELLIGPLASDHGTYGLILLLAATGQYFTPYTLHGKMRKLAIDWSKFRAGRAT